MLHRGLKSAVISSSASDPSRLTILFYQHPVASRPRPGFLEKYNPVRIIMSGHSSTVLGKKPQGQASSAEEAEMMRAMMEDLGKSRQDDLPLDDKHVSDDGSYHYHRGDTSNWGRPLALPAPFRIDDAWKRAMDAGEFDDEEAEAVKGLDTLGGGRIYNNVLNTTVRMLDNVNRNKRCHGQFSRQWAPNSQPKKKKKNRSNALPPVPAPSTSRALVPPTSRAHPMRAVTPLARPARPPRPPPVVTALPPIKADPNAPLAFALADEVFRAAINFQSREFNSAMSAIVLLSAARRPELGLFTVAIDRRKYSQWPISAWDDYTTGADNLLGVRFVDGNGASQGYDLRFHSDEELRQFMRTVRTLQAGGYLHRVETDPTAATATPAITQAAVQVAATAATQAPTSDPASNSTIGRALKPTVDSSKDLGEPKPAPTKNRNASSPGGPPDQQNYSLEEKQRGRRLFGNMVNTLRPTTSRTQQQIGNGAVSDQAPPPVGIFPSPSAIRADNLGPVAPAAAPATDGKVGPIDVVAVTLPPSKMTNGSGQENVPPEQPGKPEHDMLIDLEDDDASVVTSQHQSEAAELLSTLEPYDYNDTETVLFSADQIREMITVTLRGVMTYFFCRQAQMTPGEADETALGVKSGVRTHLINHAISQGLSDQNLAEYKCILDDHLGSVPTLASGSSGSARRIQYTAEEMLSWRHAAVEPSICLADIPYLPQPQKSSQAALSSQQRVLRDMGNKPRPTYRPSQLRRSTDAMEWVLGKEVSPQPEPEKIIEPETARTVTVSTVVMPSVAQDSGLHSSRWATDASEIKYTNNFTGPRYEKWSKRSYLEDLVQLDPQAKLNVGTEELIDFYFPMPAEEKAPDDIPSSQPANNSQTVELNDSLSGYATHTRADSIEVLRDSMSRLSIRSPAATESVHSSRPPSVQVSVPTAFSQLVMSPASQSTVPLSSPVPLPSAAESRSALAQFPTMLTQSSAVPAAQPGLRGLASSRHSSGAGPSSSGKFNFHVPAAARQ
ncbi:hypothetical protein VTI74DRAFT_7284 [Chaetomium olivicolor]